LNIELPRTDFCRSGVESFIPIARHIPFGGGADGHRSNAGESRIAASRSIQHEKTSSLCSLRWCGAPSLLALAKATNKALHASGVTELVGREEELELLLRRWSKAKSGEGQVLLLSGEPGIANLSSLAN
jgi:hypothetical protein